MYEHGRAIILNRTKAALVQRTKYDSAMPQHFIYNNQKRNKIRATDISNVRCFNFFFLSLSLLLLVKHSRIFRNLTLNEQFRAAIAVEVEFSIQHYVRRCRIHLLHAGRIFQHTCGKRTLMAQFAMNILLLCERRPRTWPHGLQFAFNHRRFRHRHSAS